MSKGRWGLQKCIAEPTGCRAGTEALWSHISAIHSGSRLLQQWGERMDRFWKMKQNAPIEEYTPLNKDYSELKTIEKKPI